MCSPVSGDTLLKFSEAVEGVKPDHRVCFHSSVIFTVDHSNSEVHTPINWLNKNQWAVKCVISQCFPMSLGGCYQ